ncbi:MAG: TssN family type VI secretion system protein [Bacteroidota bacterium]
MKETVFIIWSVLLIVITIGFLFLSKYQKRKPGKYVGLQKLGLMILSFGCSWLLFYSLAGSPHLFWSARLTVILLAVLDLWVTYRFFKWTQKDLTTYTKDSFALEFIFFISHALIIGVFFVLAPQVTGLVDAPAINVSGLLWDIPFLALLPFLIMKMTDMVGHRPFRLVEHRWSYPLEHLDVNKLPDRNIIKVNFRMHKSLANEYTIFNRPVVIWYNPSKEITLEQTFRAMMQDRKKLEGVIKISDIGGREYNGKAPFWWLFSIKRSWYNPMSWFRKPRYLNPDYTLIENKVRNNDIIVARRIPHGDILDARPQAADYDENKTIIINR